MRAIPIVFAGLIFPLGGLRSEAAPVTKAQLTAMARDGVDPSVIRAIVERDCVDFDVDAVNAADLSRALPAGVLEAAIACRKAAPPKASGSASPEPRSPESKSLRSRGPEPRAAEAAVSAVAEPKPSAPAAASGVLRVRAEFIGEAGALSCACLLDGELLATLTKPAEGEFGEAVARTKIRKESGDLPVAAGKHRLVFRCDPKAQEVAVDIETPPGQRRTVEVRETTLRGWKLRKVE